MTSEELRYVHVAGLVFGQPLLATVEAAENVGNYLRARMEGLDVRASRFVGEEQVDPATGRWKGYRTIGPVAVVSVLGELVNRGAWMGASSGLTSYEGVVQQVRQAAADPAVASIVLDINSPGGEAWGAFDAASTIRAAAGKKRLVAVANSIMASAAYALGCVADEVVVNDGGLVGSIGVVSVHFDQSERLKQLGVKATIISTGAKKAVGHPAVPLGDEGAALLQARADRLMSGFVDLVTKHRTGLSADAIYALQGDVLVGNDAVKAGLADSVGTFDTVLQDLTSRAAGRTNSQRGRSMSENAGVPAAETNAGITQAQLDAAVASAVTQANSAAEARLTADRERMAGLDDLATKCAGNADALKIVTDAKATGASVADTALALVKANAFTKAAVLGAIQTDDKSAAGAAPAAAGNGVATGKAQTREGLVAEWNASAALQAEYLTAESYAAVVLFDRKKKG